MEAQNNAIINRLMGAHAQDAQQDPQATPAQNMISNDSEVLITSNRVVSIRYKIYFLVILLVGIFAVYNYVLPSYNQWNNLKLKLIEIEGQTSIFETRKNKFEMDKNLIKQMQDQESLIIKYFNEGQ